MRFLLIIFAFLHLNAYGQNNDQDWTKLYTDPVELMREVIIKTDAFWVPLYHEVFMAKYLFAQTPLLELSIYYFMETPYLAIDLVKGGIIEPVKSVTEDVLWAVIEESMGTPKTFCRKLAKYTIKEALQDYREAYLIARKYIKTKQVTRAEAITFLDKRWGILKLAQAEALYTTSQNYSPDQTAIDNARSDIAKSAIVFEDAKIEKNKNDYIDLAQRMYKLYQIFEDNNVGIYNYEPYTKFMERMEYINKLRLEERLRWKSYIKVTLPNEKTIWDNENNNYDIEWEAPAYPKDRPMQIILANEVEQLHKFPPAQNTGSVNYTFLPFKLQPGSDYRVLILPLFVNHNNGEELAEGLSEIFRVTGENEKYTNDQDIVPVRSTFAGRNVKYTRELTFSSKYLTIQAFDHGRIDGDIVSIYINGETVISSYSLQGSPKTVQVTLNEHDRNDLFLFAHNVGSVPPNTVALRISDGISNEKIELNSNLGYCEAIVIHIN